MKGTIGLLVGVFVAVIAVTVPFSLQKAYASDVSGHIERLIPSESQAVEVGGGEALYYGTLRPFPMSDNTGNIESLLPSESQEAATGGGEAPYYGTLRPLHMGNNTGHIESLLPSEDQ